jgi:ATP-binding cassette subfamily F protein 3
MRLHIPEPARAGEVVLALEGVAQRYGDHVVYDGLDFSIRRGERVALVGPNGAGKSTLLRIAAGRVALERGVRNLGHNVRTVFYAQHQLESLDPERTVLGELERDAALADIPRLRDHLGSFLFSGDDVQKRVSVLSGGEKARLALAKLLLRPANFLVLDEPTNHLDVAACEVLEDALRSYTGTLLFVTHDRTLVNAVATRVVDVRAGRLRDFHGNYDAYLQRLEQEAQPVEAADAATGAATPRESHQNSRERRRAAERAAKQLARIEAEIGEREKSLEALRWRAADPAVYRDGEQMRALEADRVAEQAVLDALYREWTAQAEEAEANDEPAPAAGRA